MFLSLFLVFSLACDNAADMQREAATAQTEANAKIAAAAAAADQKSRDAQAVANQAVAAASSDFQALREAYRHTTTTALADLDAKIAALDAKALRANGADKVTRQTKLASIRTNRAAFVADYDTLDSATMSTWDAEKARLDARWATLKDSVEHG